MEFSLMNLFLGIVVSGLGGGVLGYYLPKPYSYVAGFAWGFLVATLCPIFI